MSTKIDQDLAYASELIKRGDYDMARLLLQRVDHPTAREWLAKLDQIAPASKPTPVKKQRRLTSIPCLVGLAIIACIAFIGIMALAQDAGIIPKGYETKTKQAETKEAARSTDEFFAGQTATTIALTPTATASPTLTPSATFTASITPLPSDTPLPTNTPRPTATRTMQEDVESLIKNTDDTGLRDSDVESVTVNANSIYLRYRLKEAVLSTGELREQADEDYKLIACHLYDRGYRQTFAMTALAEGTDAFGNTVWLEAVEITVSPSNVARFNCDDVNSINLSAIASQYYVHPSIDD